MSPESRVFAQARNRAICGRGDSLTRCPAGRRSRSISGPRFRRKPHPRHATETSVNAPPEHNRPPSYEFLARSRNPDSMIPRTTSPGTPGFRVGPKSGDLWSGRLPTAGPASRRNWPICRPRFRRKPSPQHATETSVNTPPEPNRPPYEFLPRSRNPDSRTPRTMSPETPGFLVGRKSGDLWAGRLPTAGPRQSAQLVNFRTPFSPETCYKRATETSVNTPPASNRPLHMNS